MFSKAPSIDKKFIIYFIVLFFFKFSFSYSENNTVSEFDKGIIVLMYHRFNEHKYPSTNIQLDIFENHIDIIEELNIDFLNPNNLEEKILKINNE